jgi:hypothetical protein
MTFSKSRLLYLFALLATFMLSSCVNKEFVTNSKIGKVCLSLSPEITFKTEDNSGSFSDYHFKYIGVGDYGDSEYYRYGDISWPMDWYFGIFRLQAQSCSTEQAEEGYGCLRYEGISDPFSVINGQIAYSSVTCRIANCMVKVNFDNAMYESFMDFKITVDSITAPEPDPETGESENPSIMRSLDLNPVNKVGYYNMHLTENLNLKYKLYVKQDGATDFIECISGYFCEDDGVTPAIVRAGDSVTLNVRYVGAQVISPNIKFLISGERKSIANNIVLEDYTQGSVKEDK